MSKQDTSYYILKSELESIGAEKGINWFYHNCDKVIEHFLLGPGSSKLKLKKSELNVYYEFWTQYKPYSFSKHLPVPNKLLSVIQVEENRFTVDKSQLLINQHYLSLLSVPSSTKYRKLYDRQLQQNQNTVGNNLISLAKTYSETIKEKAYKKSAIFRKHVFSGSVPMTGRSVITSVTGVSNPYEIHIPWKSALSILQIHLFNFLYQKGLSPLYAQERIAKAVNNKDPLIEEFFDLVEQPMHGMIMCGRNPTLEYLNSKLYYLRVKRDLTDDSIGFNIQQVKESNSDFDGENIAVYKFS